MDSRVTLLIHAAAPSTRRDDDIYAAQAEVCAQALKIQVIHPLMPVDTSDYASHDQTGRSSIHTRHDILSDTQFALTTLETQLISSSLVDTYRGLAEQPTAPQQGGFVGMPTGHPPEALQYASTDDLHDPRHSMTSASCGPYNSTSPTRCNGVDCEIPGPSQSSSLQSPFQQTRKRPRQSDCSDVRAGNTEGPRASRSLDTPMWSLKKPSPGTSAYSAGPMPTESRSGNDTASELPTSYSVSDLSVQCTDGGFQLCRDRQRSASDPGPHSAIDAAATEICHHTLQVHRLHEQTAHNAPTSRQLSISPKLGRHATHPPSSSHRDLLTSLPIVIQPPGPAVGVQSLTTQVTKALRYLAEHSEVRSVYNPVTVTRSPHFLERGHWLVSCADWPNEVTISFWYCLQSIIGTGSAGWGVWCSRAPEEHALPALNSPSSARDDLQAGQDTSFRYIRVYCWGEVVRHVYLVLYIASKARVRKGGLQWIDSSGDVVVQMRGS